MCRFTDRPTNGYAESEETDKDKARGFDVGGADLMDCSGERAALLQGAWCFVFLNTGSGNYPQ